MDFLLHFFILLLSVHFVHGDNFQPEQIHLSYTSASIRNEEKLLLSTSFLLAVPNEMTVTWSTQSLTNDSRVEYSLFNETLQNSVNATLSTLHDGSTGSRTLYFYRATMKNLLLNTTYSSFSDLRSTIVQFFFSLSRRQFGRLEREIFLSNDLRTRSKIIRCLWRFGRCQCSKFSPIAT